MTRLNTDTWGVSDGGDWIERAARQDVLFTALFEAGILQQTPDQLESVEAVGEFISLAYWVHGRHGGRLIVEKPDALIQRIVELAGEMGIRDVHLREVLRPLSTTRIDSALARLQKAGVIIYRHEMRADKKQTLRPQRIWFQSRESPGGP